MSEEEKLTCQKLVRINDGVDNEGRPRFYHQKCGEDASKVKIGGMLTTATAILCAGHREDAQRESFISDRGFKRGKAKDGVTQTRIIPVIR
jgi:hypothetical protein